MVFNDCGGGDYDYVDDIDVDDKTRPGLQRCSDFSAASVPFLKSEYCECEEELLLRPIKVHYVITMCPFFGKVQSLNPTKTALKDFSVIVER